MGFPLSPEDLLRRLDALGKTFTIKKATLTVIGVTPPGRATLAVVASGWNARIRVVQSASSLAAAAGEACWLVTAKSQTT